MFAIALTLLIIDIKIPSTPAVETAGDLWIALKKITPSIFAFVLSFAVILVTWVNHHGAMKLIDKTSGPFIYANGLLLLTVVIVPFPTSLLGEHLGTNRAAPAVVIYCAVFMMQAVAWACFSAAALGRKPLTRSDEATRELRENSRYSYVAGALYTACMVAAFWFPNTVAGVMSVAWVFWIVLSISAKHD